jgi:hypothetical protein
MTVPTPSIYLRDKFAIRPGANAEFLQGKESLLRNTVGTWKLIAACGSQSLIRGEKLPEPSPPMMHVWQMKGWGSAYDSMYAFTEARWYRVLEDSLAHESQDFLVGITTGYGVSPRPEWKSDRDPGHCYLYEEVLLKGTTQSYLKDLNWFTAKVVALGWTCVWVARQITAQPSTICLLWSVPDSTIMQETLHRLANDTQYAARYERMMGYMATLSRECLYPIYTEQIDTQIRRETRPEKQGER